MNPGPNSGDAFDREIASDGLNAITWFKTNRDYKFLAEKLSSAKEYLNSLTLSPEP
jgi:hypothetical protein